MCNIRTIPRNLVEDLLDLQKAQLEDNVFGKLYKSIENAEVFYVVMIVLITEIFYVSGTSLRKNTLI